VARQLVLDLWVEVKFDPETRKECWCRVVAWLLFILAPNFFETSAVMFQYASLFGGNSKFKSCEMQFIIAQTNPSPTIPNDSQNHFGDERREEEAIGGVSGSSFRSRDCQFLSGTSCWCWCSRSLDNGRAYRGARFFVRTVGTSDGRRHGAEQQQLSRKNL
jgi:hypothetical protein